LDYFIIIRGLGKSSPLYFYNKGGNLMGTLYTDSFHSKHAGQTIDDAIDGWRNIAETL
jgi:hypothetical protein